MFHFPVDEVDGVRKEKERLTAAKIKRKKQRTFPLIPFDIAINTPLEISPKAVAKEEKVIPVRPSADHNLDLFLSCSTAFRRISMEDRKGVILFLFPM